MHLSLLNDWITQNYLRNMIILCDTELFFFLCSNIYVCQAYIYSFAHYT